MHVVINARATIVEVLPKGGIGAEIGVFRGSFSRVIFANARPKKLFLVDPWENSARPEHAASWYAAGGQNDMEKIHGEVTHIFGNRPYAGRVEVVRSGSVPWLSRQADESLDFVYIDGDHSYDAVRQDIALSVAKVRSGGVIAVDDYSLGQWWGDGVVRAVHEALVAHPLTIAFCAEAQVALRRL
ncbi:class I SAM-dependent methyltransferase [Roseomonas sp. CAU 1739]|uniref:class I SAM-dependent methyltransferase n=1 Tax=Roseomonas sp. CAU 1739 TaxID=3140364 RepID=UPI00325AB40D